MKKKKWTKEKIQDGFERYMKEFGHLPTAHEVDNIEYLPSSRCIQLQFGGLQKLRFTLGYTDTHFGHGTFRSKIATNCNHRGRKSEIELEKTLASIFGEVFVHTEKIFGTLKNRLDFYIYTPDGNFGIDIFYPGNIKYLQSNVNIKIGKYCDFNEELYFVVANKDIQQNDLDHYVSRTKKPFPQNIRLVTLKTFLNTIKNFRRYPNPISNI